MIIFVMLMRMFATNSCMLAHLVLWLLWVIIIMTNLVVSSSFNITSSSVFSVTMRNENNDVVEISSTNTAVTTLVLIHVAKKHHNTRLVKLRETWLQDSLIPSWANVIFYTMKDDGPTPGPFPTIVVDTNEKPHNGNEQILSALTLVYQNFLVNSTAYPSLKWILKVDDDTYLSWTSLETALTTKNPDKPLYIGDCDCTSPSSTDTDRGCGVDFDCSPLEDIPTFKYACGGSGILMTKMTLKLLAKEESTRHCLRTIEDITLAQCLLSSNVFCEEMEFTAFLSLKTFGQIFLRSAKDEDFVKVCGWEVTSFHEYHMLHHRYMNILGSNAAKHPRH
jgi:hypothetical protein